MIIRRKWCMPNKETFSMIPASELISTYVNVENNRWVDPFARNSTIAYYTNDINPHTSAKSHMDALEFLKTFETGSIDGVLFDPPYSLRQIKECYDGMGKSLTQEETQYFYSNVKKEICRILKEGGICISFGWNSGGVSSKEYKMEILEILLMAHGGVHNDTIATVQRKLISLRSFV